MCPFPREDSRPINQAMLTTLDFSLTGRNEFQMVDVNPTPRDFAVWVLLQFLGRCPLPTIFRFYKLVDTKFPVSTIFTNAPLAREKGSLVGGGGFVGDLGGWPTPLDWTGGSFVTNNDCNNYNTEHKMTALDFSVIKSCLF